jgi:GAF domain-containing protein
VSKEDTYKAVENQILAVLEDEDNITARMATVSCLLAQTFPSVFFWTGFYVVAPEKADELVVGPYQGTLGCLRIPFGRGVCGTAAVERETQIVPDVHAIANHITCDSRTKSEIVVPVFDYGENLIGVLDIDSEELGSFDDIDRFWLEKIVQQVFATPKSSATL